MMQGLAQRLRRWLTDDVEGGAPFLAAFVVLVLWLVTGPLLDGSPEWRQAHATGTAGMTLFVLFVTLRRQKRTFLRIQGKLDELARARKAAVEAVHTLETLSDDELDGLRRRLDRVRALRNDSARSRSGIWS